MDALLWGITLAGMSFYMALDEANRLIDAAVEWAHCTASSTRRKLRRWQHDMLRWLRLPQLQPPSEQQQLIPLRVEVEERPPEDREAS